MNMHWVDWAILAALVVFITYMAVRTTQYTRSVADFLAANRCVGKYLLGVADGIAGLGAISIVGFCEMYYKAGFTGFWWNMLPLILYSVVGLTGWVQYRFRQTRAMTMAQFFEMRYSRSFRIAAGLLGWLSGVINFGIFPAVGARFFQYYCGLPRHVVSLGEVQFDLVYAGIMFALLSLSLAFTFMGGQIAVCITDFFQGMFCNIVFVVLSVYLLIYFTWPTISEAVVQAPPNASLLDPLDNTEVDNFNATYFLIQAFVVVYTWMAWQGNQGYFGAAKSPHHARMGRVIGGLRYLLQTPVLVIMAVCAYTLLHHPDFAPTAAAVESTLNSIPNEQLQSQLRVTVSITHSLPIGLFGAFAAVMFAAFVSTHDTYLHSWGAIFIQDVYMPIRNSIRRTSSPLEPRAHLWLLRLSILAVAVFIFLFSLFFQQRQDILMFFALTGTIYLGWAGTAIVGGLYWRYGTTAGVWAAMIVGVILAFGGWCAIYQYEALQAALNATVPGLWQWARQTWPALQAEKFPLNAQVMFFWTMMGTLISYIVVSLITGRGRAFDLDRMLHRDRPEMTATADAPAPTGVRDVDQPLDHASVEAQTGFWARLRRTVRLGDEYRFDDKVLCVVSYGYIALLGGTLIIGTTYAWFVEISDEGWLAFWRVYMWLMIAICAVVTIWVAIGGIRDVRELFRLLGTIERDERDDGTVVGNVNLDEVTASDRPPTSDAP